MNSQLVTIERLVLLRETAKAIQVKQDPRNNREDVVAWVPLSQIDTLNRYPAHGEVTIRIPQWLADEKGFWT